MDLLNAAKSNVTGSTSRKDYSLTEVVGILSLIQEGMKITDIALLTNRSVHSLRYKFFEKTALKGKDKPRSIHQYHSIEELYQAHNATFSQEDLDQRVAEFKKTLQTKV